tara:strand:+ start:114 stop:446 length:333 start_codon:yes stop_codon:yes gene_type:complete
MAKTPFKMKSGNSPLYKNLGSSPVKQEKTLTARGKTIDLSKKSDKEVDEVANRQVDKIKKKGDTYMGVDAKEMDKEEKMDVYNFFRETPSLEKDSLDASLNEMQRRKKSK